jgi:hypothetical protein
MSPMLNPHSVQPVCGADYTVLDGLVELPSIDTCDPDYPSRKCAERRKAEASGTMFFHTQARGWVYPRLVVMRPPIGTWSVCPFCLMGLPPDEVPALARELPYTPPVQPDNPK